MTVKQCRRCGDSIIHGAANRYQLRAYDLGESSGALYEGGLCAARWNDLVRFMAEDPCERRWATA